MSRTTLARRYEPDDMSEMWKRWEGRTVDGRFPLQSYLGGSDHSAVFLTVEQPGIAGESGKAAIKVISGDSVGTEKLARWKSAIELRHPNLISIFEAGRCELDGTELLYVVEEYAEENLSQILPERALTAEEAQGMLPPVLQALRFLHSKGFVHGHIQPSNILAVGDQVKLSTDALGTLGDVRSLRKTSDYDPPELASGAISATTDVWQLGMTLIEVLTQRLPAWDRTRSSAPEVPAAVAQPFREIAGRCLQADAGKRWTIADILARLKRHSSEPSPMPVPSENAAPSAAISGKPKASKTWSYLLGLAVVTAVAFVLIPRPKPLGPPAALSTQSPPVAAENSEPGAQASMPREAQPSSAVAEDAAKNGATAAGRDGKMLASADENGVVRRVVPQVSPSARRTIHGRIAVRVKVKVDAAGNVEVAKLESGRGSKYFSRLALNAARDWKFSPAPAGEPGVREWKLQFAFSRARTEASAVRPR